METTLEKKLSAVKILKIVFWIVLAALSLTVVRRYLVSIDSYREIMSSLDEKRTTVFSLITAATAVSTAITLIPGDTGTPIAQQIAELSEYFIVVLGALYLEKYLLTILGFLSSVILIPASCALSVLNELRPRGAWMKRLAITLLVVGLACVLVIPASVGVSNSIDRTFHESIQSSLDAATESSEQLGQGAAEESGSLWDSLSNAAQSVVGGVSSSLEDAKTALQNVIESVTIMLVTNCVIPIAVVIFFVWAVRQIVRALYTRPTPPREEERPGRRFHD